MELGLRAEYKGQNGILRPPYNGKDAPGYQENWPFKRNSLNALKIWTYFFPLLFKKL